MNQRILEWFTAICYESCYGMEDSTNQGETQSAIISNPIEEEPVTDTVTEPVLH